MNSRISLLIIAALGLLFLIPGLYLDTGVTTKDEYLLSLRTPIEMIEQGTFLTPYLDHAPRLKKAPLLYWLMYGSYKVFGVNLFAARIWAVLSAIGLAFVTGAVARRISSRNGWQDGVGHLVPAIIVLSCAGVAIQGRMALLDLPLAFLTTLTVYLFILWKERPRRRLLIGAAISCGLSALLKGPVGPMVAVVAAALNIWLLGGWFIVARRWLDWVLATIVTVAVVAPWGVAMYLIWGTAFTDEIYTELVGARFLTTHSTGPEAVVGGILGLLLPWSLLYLRAIGGAVRGGITAENRERLWLLAWSFAAIVPFLMLKVKFERYLLVAVPPAVLLLTMTPYKSRFFRAIAEKGTALMYAAVGLFFIGFGAWFRISPVVLTIALFVTLAIFCVGAWRGRSLATAAVFAGLFHMLLFGVMYPRIGIQEVPTELVSKIQRSGAPAYYFRGDNPGMLSVRLGTSVQKLRTRADMIRAAGVGSLVIVEEKDFNGFREALKDAGVVAGEPVLEFSTFYSRGNWIRFAREDATDADWDRAKRERSLEGLKTRFSVYRPVPAPAPAPQKAGAGTGAVK